MYTQGELDVNKPHVSFGSIPNERYVLGAPSSHDHDNEDEYLVDESSDSSSVYLCVLDGHDGRNAVEFVKKYLQSNIYAIVQSDNPENDMKKCIKDVDAEFFKSIDQFIDEKSNLQDQIPKVNSAPLLIHLYKFWRFAFVYSIYC